MKPHVYYEPVSIAIEKLREKGFTEDFNLEENYISCKTNKFSAQDFDIVEIYRYEGNTDPADEATVYGIASRSGLKGILVTGYGASGEKTSEEILAKLSMRE